MGQESSLEQKKRAGIFTFVSFDHPNKMYYKLNGVTQRLAGATPAAYSPQGLKVAVPAEPTPLIFASPTKVVSEAGYAVESMGSNKVPDLQKLFQKNDGIPIHLKRGLMDKMLYRTTMGLTIAGAAYCVSPSTLPPSPRSEP